MWFPLLCHACIVYAARLEDAVELTADVDVGQVNVARLLNSMPAEVAEQLSAEEVQQELQSYMEQNKPRDTSAVRKDDVRKFGRNWEFSSKIQDEIDFLDESVRMGRRANKAASKSKAKVVKGVQARVRRSPRSARFVKQPTCQAQLGGLLVDLMKNCDTLTQEKKSSLTFFRGTCPESVKSIFLYGQDVAEGSVPLQNDVEAATQLLDVWVPDLARPKHDGLLWSGFWTNASDPKGKESRTSKEHLQDFARLINAETVHPSTALGRMVNQRNDLVECQGPVPSRLKHNMWTYFSFSFVREMKEKGQQVIVALVHKKLEGPRRLNQSTLFQYEMPSTGVAAWTGLGCRGWSPQMVVIDLLGTCNQTSSVLRKQLYSPLPTIYARLFEKGNIYSHSAEKREKWSVEDFVRFSRLSWTCLDCPEPHCQLNEALAKQVDEMLQAQLERGQGGKVMWPQRRLYSNCIN